MRALLKIFIAVALSASMSAAAQEEMPAGQSPSSQADTDIEINLKALEALRPERESRVPDEPVLLPPTSPQKQGKPAGDNAPPTISAPPDTIHDAPPPDSPAAPRMHGSSDPVEGHPATSIPTGTSYSVSFEAGSADLSLDASDILDKVAAATSGNTVRLQLFGFAGRDKDSPTATRRLALQRTIAVRGYLMNQGIPGGRIDLRPQGPQKDDGPDEGVLIKLLGS